MVSLTKVVPLNGSMAHFKTKNGGELTYRMAFIRYVDDTHIEVEANDAGEPLYTSYGGKRHTLYELQKQFEVYSK